MLNIKFFGHKDTPGFNLDYLLNELTMINHERDRLLKFDNLFDENFDTEIHAGTQNFLLDINGRRVLGDEKMGDGLSTHGMMREFNNAFFDLLTKDKGVINLDIGSSSNLVRIGRENDDMVFYDQGYAFGQTRRKFDNDRTNLTQAVEEVIKIIKEYKKIWLDAILKLQPHRKEEIRERLFGKPEKIDRDGKIIKMTELEPGRREAWQAWMPLEEKWEEYKKQHNITDEDVKKAIAEEEKKMENSGGRC